MGICSDHVYGDSRDARIGKDPAIKSMLAPLFRIEEQYADEHKEALEIWKQQCFEHSLVKSKEPLPMRPGRKELIINDATLEAINACLSNNPKGLLLYQDELRAWINSMNKYRSGAGSDNEFWLSNWSSASVKVNRQGKDPLYIKRPYVNTIGGIQPGVLGDMVGGGKSESGFLARILFVYPDLMMKPHDTDTLPDHSVYESYNKILNKLNNLPNMIQAPETDYENWTIENIKLKMEADALVLYKQFLRENTDAINKSDDETVKGIYVKMESYCLRFALVLQLLHYCCSEKDQITTIEEAKKMKISKKSIKGSIQLVNYFKKTAFKVIMRFDSPVNELPPHKKIFYEKLPDQPFKTKYAVDFGGKVADMKERTVKRLLNDKKLFKRLSQGLYEKNYI